MCFELVGCGKIKKKKKKKNHVDRHKLLLGIAVTCVHNSCPISHSSLLFVDGAEGYRVASVKLIPKSVKYTIYFVMLLY